MTSTTFPSNTASPSLSKISSHSTECSAQAKLDGSFAAIDWQAPWLYHLSQLKYLSNQVLRLSEQKDNLDKHAKDSSSYNTTIIAELLNTALLQQTQDLQNQLPQTKPSKDNHAHTLKFVAQGALPEGEGYEPFIATTGKIPTRDNLHDLFNGSIWLTFPKTKALLNYHHMLQIAKSIDKQGRNESRGRVRDTITVFDENGAVLVTSDASISEALIDFNWQKSLVAPRERFDNPHLPKSDAKAAVYIFGHALLEQLLQPRKPLCAHSVIINVTAEFFALSLSERMIFLDAKLAEYMHILLSQVDITPRQLAPLPILGIPNFWADNSDASFYNDDYVFRSGRRKYV